MRGGIEILLKRQLAPSPRGPAIRRIPESRGLENRDEMTTENQPLSTLREIYDDIELVILFDWLKIGRPAALQAIDLDATRQRVRPEEASGPIGAGRKRPEGRSASRQQAGLFRQSVKALRSRGHSCNTWITQIESWEADRSRGVQARPLEAADRSRTRRERYRHQTRDLTSRRDGSYSPQQSLCLHDLTYSAKDSGLCVQFSIASSFLVSPPTRMQ